MRKNKRLMQTLGILAMVVIIAGCSRDPISSSSTGIWDRWIIYNLSQLLIWISGLFGNSYGLGITVFTILLRLLLFPLSKMQMESQRQMMELQPELEEIREKYPGRDRHSLEQSQLEQQELLESRGVNQFASMIPLLIQLPIMIALYQSIIRTPSLYEASFLWMDLSHPDPYYILPLLSAGVTLANSYLSTKANIGQQGVAKVMMFTMPALILVISLQLPAAVTWYLLISNLMTLIQTLLFNNPYKIIAERRAEYNKKRALERELQRAIERETGR